MINYGTLVSIGIPVYNGAETISRAIDSILRQTYKNIEIVISDNCSTDNTELICNQYIELNSNIRFFKQSQNNGVAHNFQFVLDKSNGELFMWAAADDEWGEEFVSLALEELINDDGLIGVTIAPYTHPCAESVGYGYFGIENDSPAERVKAIIKVLPDGNARFYCLYIARELKKIDFSVMGYLAWDWIAVVEILMLGKIRVIYNLAQGFTKHVNGESTQKMYLLSQCHSYLDVVRPLRHLTNAVPSEMRRNSYLDLIRIELSYMLRMMKTIFLFFKYKTQPK
jgi:glycosyltransferase involved in cell wall biosynthesis